MKAIYQGKKVTLDKPSYIKSGQTGYGRKKFQVYTKVNNKIKRVMFGQPGMTIKKNMPKRQKSFLARHKCKTAKDKSTPRYWSCFMWQNR